MAENLRVVGNEPVHHGLREGRFVRLVVAMLPVAIHVDEHVAFELHAEIHRELRDHANRFRIVAVDMEDRGFD